MAQTLSAKSRPAILSSAARRENTEHTDWGSRMRSPRASRFLSLSVVDVLSASTLLSLVEFFLTSTGVRLSERAARARRVPKCQVRYFHSYEKEKFTS